MKKINPLLCVFISAIVAVIVCFLLFSPICHAEERGSLRGLSPTALKYAVNAYHWALSHHAVRNNNVLTIVDFSKPSYQRRLWVINLETRRVLMKTYVAQGRNSGAVYATRFSNQPGSRESSLGIFTTGDEYSGAHGKSMRLNGLEAGINNNAYTREIVVHPAPYVTPQFIKQTGYAGRSWGCFALNPARIDQFMRLTHGGSVLFAYAAPEKQDPHVNHVNSGASTHLFAELSGDSLFDRLFG
ncbi:MAG: hypothetical protein A3I77_07410 [Gammaproteobacteria bacterium RIFCSPLOWO2_02_FULL_42_14]|nr:MAG: hypothetical protein A3B71_03240 [Gammaproteobacteria bacterium RIFCSPHIGHO2_02_FULL_42_43]OGT28345.1 MAG: hypothetical protein A2624_04315 [Gammaproteobacteria bacterium RIFCSPHIGHO2_01_FULL_42_8]OGT53045.1 MAG: hypothetical protein A3E54_08285 [Gammaproteobacteria bacterium RIFCSPHIGHO2_12_FULL_41_25]OGT61181.1 MAG: hypothetical protein A3I77_07410 [Gammaproteobacteria bacterium RIFCSPLOWO2_02_FULL_42_14]OGT87108.1 MAG: hypothetical protein A3G86_01130 [Gammaproteobacteria bacterium R